MMLKLTITSLILFTTAPFYAQQSGISIQLTAGYSANHTSNGMGRLSGDLLYHFSNTVFTGVQSAWGINGNRSAANNVIWNGTNSVLIGKSTVVSDRFRVQAYTGVGFQISRQTAFAFEDASTIPTDLISKGVQKLYSKIGNYDATAQRYAIEKKQTIGIPVGVDFISHRKSVGIMAGIYMFASNYSEVGVRVGLTFGK